MIFVHVVRNPLDMASTQWEHVQSRTHEFTGIHGGDDEAAALMRSRCKVITHDKDILDCALESKEFQTQMKCGKVHADSDRCRKVSDSARRSSWRCMEMMLWSEMNLAVSKFGERCLKRRERYLVWHGEDGYGLRGPESQLHLQLALSGSLILLVKEYHQ